MSLSRLKFGEGRYEVIDTKLFVVETEVGEIYVHANDVEEAKAMAFDEVLADYGEDDHKPGITKIEEVTEPFVIVAAGFHE